MKIEEEIPAYPNYPEQDQAGPIKPPHDNLFRGALENPLVAEEFFRTHLPANIYSMINKETLQIENESFIEKDLTTDCEFGIT